MIIDYCTVQTHSLSHSNTVTHTRETQKGLTVVIFTEPITSPLFERQSVWTCISEKVRAAARAETDSKTQSEVLNATV